MKNINATDNTAPAAEPGYLFVDADTPALIDQLATAMRAMNEVLGEIYALNEGMPTLELTILLEWQKVAILRQKIAHFAAVFDKLEGEA